MPNFRPVIIQSRSDWYCKLRLISSLAIGGAIIFTFFGNCTFAQPTPDTTLGAESSVVTPSVVINGILSDQIDGGAVRGINLFHSFQEFNIGEGQGVYFSNPTGIQNILSRVTGANHSNILGTLGVLGDANLFLINPQGIIFGRNASLDVRGSFVATTANAVRLGDTGLFSASEPATSNLLTVDPSALFFNAISSQGIVNRSTATSTVLGFPTNGLQVPNSQSLLLVGGDVSLDGGILLAPGGRVELGGLAGSGTVGLNIDGNNLRLSFPDGLERANVSLTNVAQVNVLAGGGGDIAINARNLDISEGSSLLAGIESGLGSSGSRAGDITLNATERITVTGIVAAEPEQSTRIRNNLGTIRESAIGDSGDIILQTGELTITDNVRLSASTFGEGNAGTVSVMVTGPFSLSNSFVASGVSSKAIGNSSGINIEAGSLSLTEGAQLITSTFGRGNAGNVYVRVNDLVSLTGGATGILSTVESGAIGNGGGITIKAGSLSLRNGAQLQTLIRGSSGDRPAGRRDAGNVSIDVRDTVTLAGVDSNGDKPIYSRIVSRNSSEGNAGSITLQANSLTLDNGALISAESASGEGGDITLDTLSSLLLRHQSLISTSAGNDQNGGNGGNITINTPLIVAVPSEDSNIKANAFTGNGGNINITAQGIFGIQRQEQNTPQSDITASSKLGVNGVVNINTLDVDPSSGLVNLPSGVVDVSGLIAQGCPGGGGNVGRGASEFIVTGRGGLPPNPSETLSSETVWSDLRPTTTRPTGNRSGAEEATHNSTKGQLIEAQGWVINNKGEVVLTEDSTHFTLHIPWVPVGDCHTPKTSS